MQGDEKVEDTRQGNLIQSRGRQFHRGIVYSGGRGMHYWCFRCGVEGHQEFECSNYNIQESKLGQHSSLNT